MIKYFYSKQVSTTPDQIWKNWKDVSFRNIRNKSIDSARIAGSFNEGTTITIDGITGNNQDFIISKVVENGFTIEKKLLAGKLVLNFQYALDDKSGEVWLKHSFGFKGLSKYYYSLTLGDDLSRDINSSVDKLANILESHHELFGIQTKV